MKAVVAAFNQEKALVGAFSVIMNLRMELFEALVVLYRGNQENIAKITWEYDVLSELGKRVSCVVWNAGIHATLGGGLGVFEDDTQLCHYDIFIMCFLLFTP